MSEARHVTVDRYIDALYGTDDVLEATLARADAEGLPSINVSRSVGRLLHVLALTRGARTILEIGTLAGFSTICLARALPEGGRLISLEYEPRHAEIARNNLRLAGVDDRVEIRVGRGLDSLAELEREGAGPFDLVFIDADKPPYADYFAAALRLSAPGTLIVADNVIRSGKVAEDTDDDAIAGIQRFNAALAAEPRTASTIVQIVGDKGHDGLALAVVR